MEDADPDLIALVNRYIQTYRTPKWTPDIKAIIKKLGWSKTHWKRFREQNHARLVWDYIPTSTRSDMVKAIADSRGDLEALGLSEKELESTLAMQQFGERRFGDAAQIFSSNVFISAVKYTTMQRDLERRLAACRAAIEDFGPFKSEERDYWVSEEQRLLRNYVAIGRLLNQSQQSWYQGAAQLAMIRMRVQQSNDKTGFNSTAHNTQRGEGKPGFRPRVVEAQIVESPSQDKSHDETPNQETDGQAIE